MIAGENILLALEILPCETSAELTNEWTSSSIGNEILFQNNEDAKPFKHIL